MSALDISFHVLVIFINFLFLLNLAEVKKIILEFQGVKRHANSDVLTEMSRLKLRASPEPSFSPNSRLRKVSMESGATRIRQYSFDSTSQCNLDAMISAEILTRVEFLCDLRFVHIEIVGSSAWFIIKFDD